MERGTASYTNNSETRVPVSIMSHFSVLSFDPVRPTSAGPSFGVANTARAEILLVTPGASVFDWLGVDSVSRLVGAVHSVNDRC
jgi:hypothetical protein